MRKKLYILKLGPALPSIVQRFGESDAWMVAAFGAINVEVSVVDAVHGAPLPRVSECAGILLTGARSMVTEKLPWSVKIEKWLPDILDAAIPVFGICYGHQLLAQAAGGEVGYHPRGKEIGTVNVQLSENCADDRLFKGLPESFPVQTSHSQTVLRLPPGAKHLASNAHDPNHAFRLGDVAWGVQFHPEFHPELMRLLIRDQAKELETEGHDVQAILDGVTETRVATAILRTFARFVDERVTNNFE